jgi:ribosomal protein S12 methylthiotransferase
MAEIHDAIRLKEQGFVKRVVVAGCLVQRHKTKLLAEAPGIDRLVGVFDRDHIVDAVRGQANPRQAHGHYLGKWHGMGEEETGGGRQETEDRSGDFAPGDESEAARILRKQAEGKRGKRLAVFEDDRMRLRLTPRHFAYLRMSEGCNQGCGFCTIPSIRGPMRSKPVEQIMAEARELASDGAVEILLIGQDTTSYGTDIGAAYDPGSPARRGRGVDPADVRLPELLYG